MQATSRHRRQRQDAENLIIAKPSLTSQPPPPPTHRQLQTSSVLVTRSGSRLQSFSYLMEPPPSLSFSQYSHPQHHHAAPARTPHKNGQQHGPPPISAAGCGRRPFESIAEDLLGAAVLLDAGAGEVRGGRGGRE